ncbi:hypothetical protein [Allobacillus halotolerans]|uniref:Transposase n=1 Tax=Allobacillus halotolerans TaxID=570278 RepID=A0ABS6GKY1_9BACI|nr:hypothetical protein [Allobacillus halotolerans]MBU6079746.1 hypothetical protein [Allobacillus halotolerans]
MRKQTLTVIQPITCQRDAADRGQLFSFYVERLERFVERFHPVCRAFGTLYRAVAPRLSSVWNGLSSGSTPFVERLERFVERFVTFVEWLERFIERFHPVCRAAGALRRAVRHVCRAVRTHYRAVSPRLSSG